MDLPTVWVKKSGLKIELNNAEANVEYAENAGWVRYSETPEGIQEAKDFLAAQTAQAEATVSAAKQKTQKPQKKATA